MCLHLRRCIYTPCFDLNHSKINLFTKGRTASALEVTGPQHKKFEKHCPKGIAHELIGTLPSADQLYY